MNVRIEQVAHLPFGGETTQVFEAGTVITARQIAVNARKNYVAGTKFTVTVTVDGQPYRPQAPKIQDEEIPYIPPTLPMKKGGKKGPDQPKVAPKAKVQTAPNKRTTPKPAPKPAPKSKRPARPSAKHEWDEIERRWFIRSVKAQEVVKPQTPQWTIFSSLGVVRVTANNAELAQAKAKARLGDRVTEAQLEAITKVGMIYKGLRPDIIID